MILEKIDAIIKYQDANIKREKIMEEYYNDETIKKTTEIQKERKELESIMSQCKALITASNENANPLDEQTLNDLKEDISSLEEVDLNKCEDLDLVEHNIKEIEKLEAQIKDYLTMINSANEEKKRNYKRFDEAKKRYVELDRLYQGEDGLKNKALAKKKETGSRLDEAQKEISEAGQALSPEMKTLYDEIKEKNISANPTKKRSILAKVFVPVLDGYCFCNMTLEQSELSKLNTEGYVKCSKCGRIVYKK